MKWQHIIVAILLAISPMLGATTTKELLCYGIYKNLNPNGSELKKILEDHIAWATSDGKKGRFGNLCMANLSGANLSGANLTRANLSGANLTEAHLIQADLTGANLTEADLNEANLSAAKLLLANLTGTTLIRANLTQADLSEAILSEAILSRAILSEANISNAKFSYVDLEDAIFEPVSEPDKSFLGGIEHLKTVKFRAERQSGLVLFRAALKEAGLRKLEREATLAIEQGKTNRSSSSFEKYFRRIFFEWTAGYGLYPGRCLVLLLSFIPLFSLIYFFPIYKKPREAQISALGTLRFPPARRPRPDRRMDGIYRVWSDERIRKDLEAPEPEKVALGFWKAIGYAFYFSLLSAFHIGWRDFNVGSWIARLQPREYVLRATGWVRTVSGLQSLISIYLLAFWVLTYFGRPFD